VNAFDLIATATAALGFVYLLWALLRPEDF
jgi:K+-transporting ATPase KdpF subunit